MTLPQSVAIVDRAGQQTVEFIREQDKYENGVKVCLLADLSNINPVPGWTRFVTDIGANGKPVWGNGTNWVDAASVIIV